MGKLLIKRSIRNLLENSEVTKEFPWLLELMRSQPNFRKQDLNTLPKEQQTWFHEVYDLTVKHATAEWKPRSNNWCEVLPEDKRIPCQLCGTANRYIFYISNQQNGNELNVGSKCVTRYGIESKKNVHQMIKEAKRIVHLDQLTNRFSGIRSIVEEWDLILDRQEILVPHDLEKPYLALGEKAKTAYDEALEKGISPKLEVLLENMLAERELLVSQIAQYVRENKHRQYVPTRDIARRLKFDPEGRETLEMLKKDGVITWKTAHRISYPDFAKSLITPFNSLLSSVGWRIREFNNAGSTPIFILTQSQRPDVELSCVYKQFVLEFGGPVFQEGENKITLDRLISVSRLYGQNSIYNALMHISNLSTPGKLRMRGVDVDYNEFIVYDNERSKFIVCNELDWFVNQYKSLVFTSDQKLLDKAIRRLRKYRYYDYDELFERQQEMLKAN